MGLQTEFVICGVGPPTGAADSIVWSLLSRYDSFSSGLCLQAHRILTAFIQTFPWRCQKPENEASFMPSRLHLTNHLFLRHLRTCYYLPEKGGVNGEGWKTKAKKSNGLNFPLKLCFLLWRRIGTHGFIKSLLWRRLKTIGEFPLILMNFSLILEDWTLIWRPPVWVSSMTKLFLWGGERLLWIQMSLHIP